MHATENPPEDERPVDPLVAVVTRAPDGSACDGDCDEPALVAISADVWGRSLLRCAAHWPPLDEVLRSRGHEVVSGR